ncbi:MAG: 6-carboxytetrahydropterin synthase [Candidatus Poribacteria bacterium]|nr:6-carboxytetrahydropterin synthase [Candidatus Poribacteria bacterium]MDE0502898.1 6-carboxytetrahydropterin synthase [Candidatus Poribacteria bacterium]
MHYLTRQAAFEASHTLCLPELTDKENYELFGPAANHHGHNYVVEVTIRGMTSNDDGMVINLADLDQLLRNQVLVHYDHKYINLQHPVFANDSQLQPTTENIAIEIWSAIDSRLEFTDLHRVRVYEDSAAFADFYGEPRMVYLTKVYEFNASHRLHSQLLSDEENRETFGKCNNLHGHGHNYVLEVMIKGDVHPKTGMIVTPNSLDKIVHKQIHARFDHKHLNLDTDEFDVLNPTSENFVRVIWELLEKPLKPIMLHRLRLKETPRNHFDYYGETTEVNHP